MPLSVANMTKRDASTHQFDMWSIYLFLTITLRLYNASRMPIDTLIRPYSTSIYVFYISLVCMCLVVTAWLVDIMTVADAMLFAGTVFAVYDTYYSIHQSLFDVFLRTCTGAILSIIITKCCKWFCKQCCCHCCCGPRMSE